MTRKPGEKREKNREKSERPWDGTLKGGPGPALLRAERRRAQAERRLIDRDGAKAMTDVVERLRECASPLLMDMYMAKMVEAAIAKLRDEIERLKALSQNNALSWDAIVRERNELRAEIERLLAVLRCISQLDDDGEAPGLARAALEPKP